MAVNTAYLSAGSNEGNRQEWLGKAISGIAATCGTITAQSSIYETAAWGLQDQPDFLNMALCIETGFCASELLLAIQKLENELGRIRTVKWGPRTVDIDILFFNNEIINTPNLSVPHPRLHERAFVLVPLAEIAPGFMHPVLHKTISGLLIGSPDTLEVRKVN